MPGGVGAASCSWPWLAGVKRKTNPGSRLLRWARLTEGLRRYGGPTQIAEVYAYRGDKDRAFEWLERGAPPARRENFGFMRCDPFLANLHEDPRWDVFFAQDGPGPDDQLK